MHRDVRSAVPPAEVAQLERGQLPAGDGAPQHEPAGEHRSFDGAAQQPDAVEDPRRVGGQLQPGADLGELRRLLEHSDAPAGTGEQQRRGQPGDAASGYEQLVARPASRRPPHTRTIPCRPVGDLSSHCCLRPHHLPSA